MVPNDQSCPSHCCTTHEDGLRQTVADADRKYAGRINTRIKWTRHLQQRLYSSLVMDEPKTGPGQACNAHLTGKDGPVTTVAPALSRFGDFRAFLDGVKDAEAFEVLRGAEGTNYGDTILN